MRTFVGASRLIVGLFVVVVIGLVAPALAVADVTYTVTTTKDTNAVNPAVSALDSSGNISLRSAIERADVGLDGTATIDLPAGTYTLTTAGGSGQGTTAALAVSSSSPVLIDGAGASSTTIDASQLDRAFEITSPTVSISGLALTNGSTTSGSDGGAIEDTASGGSLIVSDSTFTQNSASSDGGAIFTGAGTGLTVSDSTFTYNGAGGVGGSADFSGSGSGGAIDSSQASVTGSTFSHNSAGGDGASGAFSGLGSGGAVSLEGGHSATITNSTFTDNTAGGTAGAGTSSGRGVGGAIGNGDNTTLQSDTIDANSVGSAPTSAGGGIDGATTVAATGTIVSGNRVGGASGNCDQHVQSSTDSLEGPATTDTSCGFDLTSADPLLQPLAPNGGPTQTQALGSVSPAIDAVPQASCPASDQRGDSRPDGTETSCDVGAFEVQDAADLKLTNSGAPNPVVSGRRLTYTVVATNTGAATANNVTVTDALPSSAVFDSMSTTKGSCSRSTSGSNKNKGGTLTCHVGNLTAGQNATITIVVTPTKAGTISNPATVTASNVSADPAGSDDDSATATVTVKGT